MALKDSTTLLADIAAAIPDNVLGEVSPADVRETGFVDVIHTQLGDFSATTGLKSGGLLSINALDNTKIDITDGTGIVVDYSVVSLPTTTQVSWSGMGAPGGTAVTNVATDGTTHFGIDSSGSLVQQLTEFSAIQRRSIIELGNATHDGGILIVTGVGPTAQVIGHPVAMFYDFVKAFGSLNVSGNVFSANGANLMLDKSEGFGFRVGSNYPVDGITNPHINAMPSQTALTFVLVGTGFAGFVTDIDPDNYDNGAAVVAVPNNKFTLQPISMFPGSLFILVQYGTTVYDTLEEAINGVSADQTAVDNNKDGILLNWLAIKEGTTDLTNPLNAQFITVNH